MEESSHLTHCGGLHKDSVRVKSMVGTAPIKSSLRNTPILVCWDLGGNKMISLSLDGDRYAQNTESREVVEP